MKSASDGCGYWLAPSHPYILVLFILLFWLLTDLVSLSGDFPKVNTLELGFFASSSSLPHVTVNVAAEV